MLAFFCKTAPPTNVPIIESKNLHFKEQVVAWEKEHIGLLQDTDSFYAQLAHNFVNITRKCIY